MYLGEQLNELSDRRLTLSAQLGVERITAGRPQDVPGVVQPDGAWDAAILRGLRTRIESFGLRLDVAHLAVDPAWPSLLLRTPDRDAHITRLTQNIAAAAAAGIPCLKYRMQPLGVFRTNRQAGRGGAQYSHFDVREWTDHSLSELGQLTPDDCWEAITYLVERLVPEAERYGVRLVCHPNDPAIPHDTGLRGLYHVLGNVDGMRRLLDIAPSPLHGLNFCQGTVAEMCVIPATEVLDAIRYFGKRNAIFLVHFRNITGGFLNFNEVYPDNGDVDMLAAVRAYKETGYDGMLCPDHVPVSDADPDRERQFAFCLGYIRALLQVA